MKNTLIFLFILTFCLFLFLFLHSVTFGFEVKKVYHDGLFNKLENNLDSLIDKGFEN